MRVLVDTTIWSLALRRQRRAKTPAERDLVREFETLVSEGRVLLVGPVRQEILTGVRDPAQWSRLRDHLRNFGDATLDEDDFELAAEFAGRCLAAGIAVTSTDLLVCAVAARRNASVFTTDADFARYASVIPVRLHEPRRVRP